MASQGQLAKGQQAAKKNWHVLTGPKAMMGHHIRGRSEANRPQPVIQLIVFFHNNTFQQARRPLAEVGAIGRHASVRSRVSNSLPRLLLLM